MPYANNKAEDQSVHPRRLISAFVDPCLDSIIPLVSISEISSLYLASLAAQAGLCLTWSKSPKTGFLVTRLKCGIAVMETFNMGRGKLLLRTGHASFSNVFLSVKKEPYLFPYSSTVFTVLITALTTFELPHDKTNKMVCAPSEDSDQLGHPLSLISLRAALNGWLRTQAFFMRTAKTLIRLGRSG